MRTLALLSTLLLPCALPAPVLSAQTPAHIQSDLQQSLAGSWTGVLEYRDYSEPATSSKRVQLPTWLTITPSGTSQTWHYVYDDGPAKVVEETDAVIFDPATSSYTASENSKPPQSSTVTGYNTLTNGRGQLILLGTTTDNNQPAEARVTLTIRRNLLDLLEEVRPAHSTDAFVFRHHLVFTRATPPNNVPPSK